MLQMFSFFPLQRFIQIRISPCILLYLFCMCLFTCMPLACVRDRGCEDVWGMHEWSALHLSRVGSLPFPMWLLRIRLRLAGLVASVFTYQDISLALMSFVSSQGGRLNENGPHKLIYWDVWVLVGALFWEGSKGMLLLEEMSLEVGFLVSVPCQWIRCKPCLLLQHLLCSSVMLRTATHPWKL